MSSLELFGVEFGEGGEMGSAVVAGVDVGSFEVLDEGFRHKVSLIILSLFKRMDFVNYTIS